jgi:Raf kinase inhibitor-like YbhB/YbcL family protein
MKRWIPISLWIAGQIACTRPVPDQEVFPDLAFVGRGFSKGVIPRKNSCDAGDTSPALSWKGSPANTRSFAVIATDIDSPLQSIKGPFVHWLLYGIPADKRDLPEGIPGQAQLPDGSRQGTNGFDKIGYGGPCPPGSSPHRYLFDLYALDAPLNLPGGAGEPQVAEAMKGHILAKGQLVARYQH